MPEDYVIHRSGKRRPIKNGTAYARRAQYKFAPYCAMAYKPHIENVVIWPARKGAATIVIYLSDGRIVCAHYASLKVAIKHFRASWSLPAPEVRGQ